MPVVTAVLLLHRAMDRGTGCNVFSTGGGELAAMPEVTAVQFNHSAMDTLTDCNVFSTS